MKKRQIKLWREEEYTHPNTFGFIPNIMGYLHEIERTKKVEKFPCIIVVPGGGYANVSPSEAEVVARSFYERGYQVFVLTYTINCLMGTPVKMQALRDISRAIRYIRKREEKFFIDSEKIILCGFSAGAHVCASLCVHFEDVEDEEYQALSNRPDAAILSYPVISSGEFAHQDSIRNLLGRDIYTQKEQSYEGIPGCKTKEEALAYMSLEKHVTTHTPPCFLWHTVTDALVPMENSLLFAKALKREGIDFAYHLFSCGKHGLSLANEAWGKGLFREEYTREQIHRLMRAIQEGQMKLCEEDKKEYEAFWEYQREHPRWIESPENKEVKQWFELALTWLKERGL